MGWRTFRPPLQTPGRECTVCLRRGRPGDTSAAPHLCPDAAASPGAHPRAGGEGPFPGRHLQVERGEGNGYLPGASSAGPVRGPGAASPEFQALKGAGQESRSAGRTPDASCPLPAARCSAGLLLISARSGGTGEVSAEGSRPPGRGADVSQP